MTIRMLMPFVLAAVAAPAIAASPFDGTWKTDLARSKLSTKPDVILLKDGRYTCKTCEPGFTVPADGKPHPVAGHDYFDTLMVQVLDDKSVKLTGMKAGKLIFTNDATATTPNMLTWASHRKNPVTGVAAFGTSTEVRVGAAPTGAHAISGAWRADAIKEASESASSQTIKVTGRLFTLSTPTGEGYSATFGGPAVLQKNDMGKTMVKLVRLSPSHVVETDMRKGKVVQTYDMRISPDARTMTMLVTDKRNGSVDTIIMHKQ